MSKKGQRKSQKRMSAGKITKIKRKESKWTFAIRGGTHTKTDSAALGIVIRDYLEATQNSKETKIVLNSGQISVDGKIRKNEKFGVGIFDVVKVGEKQYRVLLDKRGKLMIKEIKKDEGGFKLVKVVGKKAKGKGFEITTNDGRTISNSKKEITPGDTLKIEIPKQKVSAHYKMEKGSTAIVIGGKRTSSIGKIEEVLAGTMQRDKLVKLKVEEGKEFQTDAENVFVVGKDKAEIEVKQ